MSVTSALRLVATIAISAAVATSLTAAQADAAPSKPINYVALGDSYAAGSIVLPLTDMLTCARSAVNYPSLVAKAIGTDSFRDATCSSATIADLSRSQPGNITGFALPQYNALSKDTTLVTVTIGVNDIRLVSSVRYCVNLLPEPFGRSCAAEFTASGRDVMADRTAALAPTYGTMIDRIHERAPDAKILVVGYPTAIRPGGCPALQPLWVRDGDYLRKSLGALNAMIAKETTKHGATFVDVAASSVGHDSCADPADRWLEGLIPSTLDEAMPMHPTQGGEENMARQVLAALR